MIRGDINREEVTQIALKYMKEVINLNNYLANNPEISGEEYGSSKYIVEFIRNHNIEVAMPFADISTSFKAIINEGRKRKAAILVEYDALRGMGHGCGHCASAAISVLATLIINEIKEEIDAEIHIIGTPDEEINGKKIDMVEKGVFHNYDFAIMIHLNGYNDTSTNMLALDGLRIEFHGQSSHAAQSPWKGRNSLNAIRLLFDSIDMMRQHVMSDTRIHGIIENGGVASNIVPDYASAEFCVRAKERKYLDDVTSWVKDCAKGAALATRTEVKISELGLSYNNLIRNKTGEKLIKTIYDKLNLEILEEKNIEFGSSDIGNVSYVCPVFHPLIGIGKEYSLHTVEFANAMKSEETYDAILKGGQIITLFIVSMYKEKTLLEDMIKEFNIEVGNVLKSK